jgi:transcriptional antiterminator RfaH
METVLLTTSQLARRLGLASITLQIWRSQGIGIPFIKQGARVFYRLADVQDYERRNVQSLSAWLLGSDRPLPEMDALVRAANLPLQKIRQRITDPQEAPDRAQSLHQSPVDAVPQPLPNRPNDAFVAGMSTPRPFPPKAIELITTQHAANRLGLSTEALHELRCRDDSLPIVQKGFVVGYRLEDIQAFERREAVAVLDKVLATAHPLPMIRAIAKLVMSPPVDDMTTQQPLPTTVPAPEQSIPRVMHTPIATQAIKPETSLTPPPQYPSALSWYLIHTKARQEALALTNLSRQGFECYMPMLKLQKIRQHKTALVTEPMFPRYLFVRLDTSGTGQSWSPIRSTLGVNQLVRFGGQPAKVDGQLIDLIRSRELGSDAQPLFMAGEKVTVANGPFAGLEAIYQTADAESRSMILLNILSKPVAMRIETASLRRVG